MREMERKEKLAREQKNEKEVVDVESFCKKPDAYIINGNPGYKPLVLVDYEAVKLYYARYLTVFIERGNS